MDLARLVVRRVDRPGPVPRRPASTAGLGPGPLPLRTHAGPTRTGRRVATVAGDDGHRRGAHCGGTLGLPPPRPPVPITRRSLSYPQRQSSTSRRRRGCRRPSLAGSRGSPRRRSWTWTARCLR
ncbi:hypothetical protein ACFFX0_04730 [Citricoccus parietis]|uniref:Uncharacterized protein n=1 Tax=Citricoccus parietis TaxID=592307 RepID=A0ABV5FW75_9MICC